MLALNDTELEASYVNTNRVMSRMLRGLFFKSAAMKEINDLIEAYTIKLEEAMTAKQKESLKTVLDSLTRLQEQPLENISVEPYHIDHRADWEFTLIINY